MTVIALWYYWRWSIETFLSCLNQQKCSWDHDNRNQGKQLPDDY
ncbi:hypothetical protein [Legionella israelensis]|nr:hypothetical protein [Legionella israelensis]